MIGRQSRVPRRLSRDRLLQPHRQPVLITAGDQCRPRSRTDRRIGIRLSEPNAPTRKRIDVGRRVVPPAIAGQVGIPQIIRHDENNIRRRPRRRRSPSERQQRSSQHLPSRESHHDIMCHCDRGVETLREGNATGAAFSPAAVALPLRRLTAMWQAPGIQPSECLRDHRPRSQSYC